MSYGSWPSQVSGRYERTSQADRDRAVHVLQAAFAEGRLTFEEFEDRLERALTARSFQTLLQLTADLPAGPFGRLPAHAATPAEAPRPVSAALTIVFIALWVLLVATTLHAR